jgi:hypothetical protein
VPLTLKQAGAYCDAIHRHLGAPRGCRFAIGVADELGELHGVALCGRPVSRMLDDGLTIEINRTATDGSRNANSMLYGACWRIAAAMGYRRIVTYNQQGESGASLRAANYRLVRELQPRGNWAQSSVKLRQLRDANAVANVARNLWEVRAGG